MTVADICIYNMFKLMQSGFFDHISHDFGHTFAELQQLVDADGSNAGVRSLRVEQLLVGVRSIDHGTLPHENCHPAREVSAAATLDGECVKRF